MKQAALKVKRTREPHLGERAFPRLMLAPTLEIGRASCRERV